MITTGGVASPNHLHQDGLKYSCVLDGLKDIYCVVFRVSIISNYRILMHAARFYDFIGAE